MEKNGGTGFVGKLDVCHYSRQSCSDRHNSARFWQTLKGLVPVRIAGEPGDVKTLILGEYR
jgi:hypothetical protein